MKVIFARSNKPIALLIRLVTWSRWHHCAAITEDGKHVIEAKGGVGVRKIPIETFKAMYKTWEIADLDCVDEKKAHKFVNDQIGKPYDLKGVFGLLLRSGWDKPNEWFCSELIAAASGRFRHNKVSRVTPEHIWMISR